MSGKINWKNDFKKNLLEEGLAYNQAVKFRNFPKKLYKYRQMNERTIMIFKDNLLWNSPVFDFNDPFECSFVCNGYAFLKKSFEQFEEYCCSRMSSASSIILLAQSAVDNDGGQIFPELLAAFKSILDLNKELYAFHAEWQNLFEILRKSDPAFSDYIDSINKLTVEIKKLFRICSFSEDVYSILMWSHYAKDHQGICIEYDFRISRIDVTAFFYPVYYSKYMFHSNFVTSPPMQELIISALTKSTAWKYEKEWRYVQFGGKENTAERNYLQTPQPTAVFLGSNFIKNDLAIRKPFFDIISEKKVPLNRMEIDDVKYRLITKKADYEFILQT